MSNTTYMNLTLPTPTVTPGPEWATENNQAMQTLDAHDHSPGKGVKVPTAGLNINADLDFAAHSATTVKSVNFDNQATSLSAANVQAIFSYGGDLWFNNSSGTAVQVTQGNSIASASSPLVPSGVIWPYGGSSAPTGFLMCDGSAVSRTTYAALFAVIGTSYGVGNGSTTFNLPNAQGRAPIGAGTYIDPTTGSVTRTLGSTLGEEKHVLTVGELATHSHVGNPHTHTDSGHYHGITLTGGSYGSPTTGEQGAYPDASLPSDTIYTNGASANIQPTTASVQNTGSSTAHNNMQPSFVTNFIIKT